LTDVIRVARAGTACGFFSQLRVSVFKIAVLGEKADQGEDNEAPDNGYCNQEALDDWVEEEVLRDDTGLVSLEVWDEQHGFICLV